MSIQRYNLIKTMSMREVSKLAFAVFLIFGTLGPTSLLATGVLAIGSWTLLAVLTILSGSFSASIIFAIRKPWLMAIVIPVFIGALSNSEKIAGVISGHDEATAQTLTRPVEVMPDEFQGHQGKKDRLLCHQCGPRRLRLDDVRNRSQR